MPLPTSKDELNKLREKFSNNRRTAAYFYRNREVQYQMRIIYLGAAQIAKEFSETVKLLQKGQAAGRSFVWGLARQRETVKVG